MIEIASEIKDRVSYNEAWLYCLTLEYDGHKDWRLPSYSEYEDHDLNNQYWYNDDVLQYDPDEYWTTIPVRDLTITVQSK